MFVLNINAYIGICDQYYYRQDFLALNTLLRSLDLWMNAYSGPIAEAFCSIEIGWQMAGDTIDEREGYAYLCDLCGDDLGLGSVFVEACLDDSDEPFLSLWFSYDDNLKVIGGGIKGCDTASLREADLAFIERYAKKWETMKLLHPKSSISA